MLHGLRGFEVVCWALLVGCGGGKTSSESSPLVQGSEKTPDGGADGAASVTRSEAEWTGDCLYCSDVIDYHGDPKRLCADSARFYPPFQQCACSGVCAAICADSYCTGGDTGDACRECLNDFKTGCGTVHDDCENF